MPGSSLTPPASLPPENDPFGIAATRLLLRPWCRRSKA